MLVAKALELSSEILGVGRRQGLKAMDPDLLQHLSPFGANPAHFAEMSLLRGNVVAEPPPATERALAAISRQRWRVGSVEIGRQSLQCVVELAIQAVAKGQTLALQTSPRARHRKAIRHRPSLKFSQ